MQKNRAMAIFYIRPSGCYKVCPLIKRFEGYWGQSCMLLEIGLVTGGIPLGWLLRKRNQARIIVGRVLTWSVWALLFLLGSSLGGNAELLGQIRTLGLQAGVISTLSVAGCLVFARLLGRFLRLEGEPDTPAQKAGKREKRSPWAVLAATKNSLLVLAFFFVGMFAGYQGWLPRAVVESNAMLWLLYVLLFSAGMGVGFDLKALAIIRELKGRILLVPLGVTAGTLLGSTAAWLVLPGMALPDSLAVGAGFGYYSLATVVITKLGNPALGSVALLSNMIREIITLTLSPFLLHLSGRLGPVMAGGAAAMDTCLPVIAKYSGERYAIIAVFSGMTLTLLVPVLVPALLSFR